MFKNYFLMILIPLLAILTSCQNPQNQLDQQRKDNFVKVNEILAGGNVDSLDNYLTQDFIDHQSEAQDMGKGLAGAKNVFRYFHKVFPRLSVTVQSMAITGDTLFAYVTISGTPSEPFMGMPAGQPVTNSSVDMVRYEGDKLAEHWGFIDMADIVQMMPKDTTAANMMQ